MLFSNALNVEQGPTNPVTIPQCLIPGLGFTQHHLVAGVAQLVGDPALATGSIPRCCGSKADRHFRPYFLLFVQQRPAFQLFHLLG